MLIAAILSSASFHENCAAIPLSQISDQSIDSLYNLVDAGYCSFELQEFSHGFSHVSPIDPNSLQGGKDEFETGEAECDKIRSAVERMNAKFEDELAVAT